MPILMSQVTSSKLQVEESKEYCVSVARISSYFSTLKNTQILKTDPGQRFPPHLYSCFLGNKPCGTTARNLSGRADGPRNTSLTLSHHTLVSNQRAPPLTNPSWKTAGMCHK